MKLNLLTIALLLMGISAGAQEPISVSVSEDCSQNGRTSKLEAVDLGLSVKWANRNVGATFPEDYGYYFAWGETSEKSDYSWSTYKYCNGTYDTMTKYCTDSDYGTVDNKTTLEAEDDAAHIKWGGTWRMPTDAEWTELRGQCTWEWVTQKGVDGYLVTSKKNGNSIFLPASGFRIDTDLVGVGSHGGFWSSSVRSYSYEAYNVLFASHDVLRSYRSRYYGRSVRAVCQDGSPATDYTLTLYAEGCDAPNTFTCNAGQQLSVSAMPMEHRHFVKWNDGNTDNPRLVTMNQNLTYTAIFAGDYEGKCGDNLSWKYSNDTLTITGTGAMYDYTSSTMPWLGLRDSITEIVISDGCTSVGSYAFYVCTTLKTLTGEPATPMTLGNNALDADRSMLIYVHMSSVEAYKQQWSAYADKIYPILSESKQAAIDSVNAIINGITNAEVIAMANAAKQEINNATGGPELEVIFPQLAINLTLARNMYNAGKKDGITEGETQGYNKGKADGITEGYTEGYAASQATLPTDPEGTVGTQVVITKDAKTLTLINPDKVKYIKGVF